MKNKKEKEKFFTERDKTLFKLFLFVFFLAMIAINWSDLSWFLNIRTAPQLVEQRISSFFSERWGGKEKNDNNVEDNNDNNGSDDYIDPSVYCEENRITISSIDITAPVVETGGTTEEEYRRALDRGVVHFPGSPFPGEMGLTVLLGHSAPPGWPDINFDWVFTKIDNLQEGDKIEVCYNNKLTVYTVIDEERGKKVYEVGEDVPPLYPNENKKEIVIMSCWPPGSSESRIGVRGIVE